MHSSGIAGHVLQRQGLQGGAWGLRLRPCLLCSTKPVWLWCDHGDVINPRPDILIKLMHFAT